MAEHRSDKDYDDEDEPSKGLGLRIPPIRTFLHFLYMKRWHVLVLWLFLAIPTGILLSLFDLPNSYVSRTVVRFPSVVGAQVNMMRDVAITQKESIISTFESFQVLERTADRLRLRLRVVTPDIFRERTIRDITYSPALGEGVYRLNFAANRQVTVFFRPENGVTEYELARTPVGSDGRLSISGLELEFLPEFLRIAEGMDLRLRFQSQYKTVKALREALRIRPMGSVNYSITRAWQGGTCDDGGGLRYFDSSRMNFGLLVTYTAAWRSLSAQEKLAIQREMSCPWTPGVMPTGNGHYEQNRVYGSGGLGVTRSVYRAS